MQVIKFGQKLNTPIVICLGYFGCMHKGHVKLLECAKQRAANLNAKVALFTFSNNHLKILGSQAKVVYTFDERLEIYQNLDIDYVIEAHFDEKFRNKSSMEFVEQLKGNYEIKGVVCGFDYKCGRDRLDCNQVKEMLSGVCSVDIVNAICWNGVKISTTLIRELLKQNDISQINNLLSEPYFIIGKVAHGRHVGSEMGFPTANVEISSGKLLPVGVYGGYATFDGMKYLAIVNIGDKPTFGLDSVNIEAHVINFHGDLYGKTVKIALTKYLRGIQKFDSVNLLIDQLKKDREEVVNDQIWSKR